MTIEQRLEQVQESVDRAVYGGSATAPAYLALAMSHLLEAVRLLEARQSKEEARHEQR